MTNKKLGAILLGVALVIISGFVIFKLTSQKAEAPSAASDVSIDQVAQQQTEDTKAKQSDLQGSVDLTADEVKKHSSVSDCWTIINGKVYDLTEFVADHPGGNEILRACGTDATSLFTTRKTSEGETVGSGTPHSSSAQSQLSQFLLGDLKD